MNTIKINLRKGTNYTIYVLLFMVILVSGSLVYLKIKFPENTGLFFLDGKFRAFGMLRTMENSNEVLGIWFIPIILLTVAVFVVGTLKSLKK